MEDKQISEIVSRILRERRGHDAPSHVEVNSDTDFDGTPIIRVTAHYDRRANSDPRASIDAVHEIRTELLKRGDDRFIFLSSDYRDEPKYDEEEAG